MEKTANAISKALGLPLKGVENVLALFEEGATVPFIARYRKERTGGLDEVAIAQVRDAWEKLQELEKRKESVLKAIDEQGLLTAELKKAILEAKTLAKVEDLYLPFKKKRRTKATIAKEKGLQPLADLIFSGKGVGLSQEAKKHLADVEEALEGARHIIAEQISEDAECREKLRKVFRRKGEVACKVARGKKEDASKYQDYFDWNEPISKAPSHRLLAMFRGENEGMLSLNIAPDADEAVHVLDDQFVKGNGECAKQLKLATDDAYKRLLKPSLENEMRAELKKKADEEAIRVFSENLRELLLASPLGEKSILALDPGFRTGCKLVCLDKQGNLLTNTAIYPNEPQNEVAKAGAVVKDLVKKYGLEAVAVGNGTAGRETERFVKNLDLGIPVIVVNESGASIYSASEVAREEFPDYDVTVRGAVSIGRRLVDPLAELVKIDPKSIGVGQYQHDVDQSSLKKGLDDVVMSCVNKVGVEVNTASKQLLAYVSGVGPKMAENIIQYRKENGPFTSRAQLKKVKGLGPKAFEQSAGFLRIRGAKNPLDASAVHPESYEAVKKMASDLGTTIAKLMEDSALRKSIDLNRYVTDSIGIPTLKDILDELEKPGRDPREAFEVFSFDDSVHHPEDLKIGMQLPGIVTNVTKFGAFVDVGVHQDGLVHISQLADRFVSDPNEVVKVGQKVNVIVTEVDLARKRIALSMKGNAGNQVQTPKKRVKSEKTSDTNDLADKLAMLKGKFS